MTKTIKDLTKFNIEIEILKKTQAEMKMNVKNPVIQLENLQKSHTT